MATRISDLSFSGVRSLEQRDDQEEDQLPTISPETQTSLDANHNRVQSNLQKMIDGNAPTNEMNRYLRTEGISIDIGSVDERPTENVNVGTIGLSMARGAIKGTVGIASLPFLATDAIGYGVRRIFNEDAEFEAVVSGKIAQGGEELTKLLDPNFSFEKGQADVQSVFANRAAEKVGEFIAPGGLIIKGMTNQGAKLLAKSPETLGFFKRMFVEVAKNPAKAQAIEAGLGMTSAIAGEVAVTQLLKSGNPADIEKAGYVRFGAEIAALGLSVVGQRLGARLLDAARSKFAFTDRAQKLAAEVQIGKFFNELMEADPTILKAIKSAEDLEQLIPGLDLTTANVFQNPQVQAALAKVVQTGQPTSATRYVRMLESSRARLAKFREEVSPVLNKSDPNLKTSIGKFMDDTLDAIDSRVSAAERRAIEEADLLHPERVPESIGQSGMEQMKVLEDEAQSMVDDLYQSLDPDVKYSVDHIKRALKLAQFDPKHAARNVEISARNQVARQLAEDAGTLAKFEPEPLVGLAGKTQRFGDVPDIIIDTGLLNFGKDVNKVDMASLMEWRRLVGKHERLALIAGDKDTVARLDTLRKGVDKQFDAASKRARTGKQAEVFKTANEGWTNLKARFDKAYVRLGIQRDLTSMYKFAPEDFGRKFIRPEGGANAVQSAKDFKKIFGVDKDGNLLPSAKALLIDSVAYQLSKFKEAGKGFDMRGLQGWLTKHETNLKAHGIWDTFKDVGNATALADDVGKSAVFDRKKYEKGILQAIIDSPNLDNFIRKGIRNKSLGTTGAEVRATDNMPAARAWAREVFNTVLDKADTSVIDSVGQVVKRPDEVLLTLTRHRSDLIAGIGKEHYQSLLTIGKALKMTEGTVRTFGARADEVAVTPVKNQRALGRVFSKIRASLQGFVSPQFTAVQLANQGLDVLNSRAAQNVIEEAMYDWRYARDLANLAKSREGQRALRFIGVAAIPATRAVTESDDERTEF